MSALTYQGPEGRQYAFVNEQGARFLAYVRDSIQHKLPQIGGHMDGELQNKTGRNGNAYTQIVAINGDRGDPNARFQGGGGQQHGGSFGGKRPYTYEPRTFVSAVVSNAIASKAITKPEEIAAWAQEAYNVIKAIAPASAAPVQAPQAAAPVVIPTPQPAGQPFADEVPF